MKILLRGLLILATWLTLHASEVHARPRQYVVVVAEGVSQPLMDLGRSYIRTADEDPNAASAFDALLQTGHLSPGAALEDLSGLLTSAENQGFKTGLITTGSAVAAAAVQYGTEGTPQAVTSPGGKPEFLAGADSSAFTSGQTTDFTTAGNTFLSGQLDVNTVIKGRVLALHASPALPYSLDRDPEKEIGLAELTSMAMDNLAGETNAPFVLIVHDTLVKKAMDSGDAPALLEQFHEVNSILTDVLNRREENPELGLAVIWTGGHSPRFTTTDPKQINTAFSLLAATNSSYTASAEALIGADENKIKQVTSQLTGIYKNWTLSTEVVTAIVSGETRPEVAMRAFYEPRLQLTFSGPPSPVGAATMGFEAPQGLRAYFTDHLVRPD